jgi:alkylated DNA repair dioxygenase AlkB
MAEQPRFIYFGHAVANAEPCFLDSYFVPCFLQDVLKMDPAAVMKSIMATAPWTDPSDPNMMYRGNELARQKCFLVPGELGASVNEPPALLFNYRYPGYQYASLEAYRPLEAVPDVHRIVQLVEQGLEFNDAPVHINHVIGTCYRDAEDNIGYHSDKVKDITPDTPIVSLSFGEPREFHIGHADPTDKKLTICDQAFILGPGDLFVLGPRTNVHYRHAIVPVEEERLIERADDHEVQPRVSIVCRDIATRVTLKEAREKAKKTIQARVERQTNAGPSKRKRKAKRDSKKESKKMGDEGEVDKFDEFDEVVVPDITQVKRSKSKPTGQVKKVTNDAKD